MSHNNDIENSQLKALQERLLRTESLLHTQQHEERTMKALLDEAQANADDLRYRLHQYQVNDFQVNAMRIPGLGHLGVSNLSMTLSSNTFDASNVSKSNRNKGK